MSGWVDASKVKANLRSVEDKALDSIATNILGEARRRAPVRKTGYELNQKHVALEPEEVLALKLHYARNKPDFDANGRAVSWTEHFQNFQKAIAQGKIVHRQSRRPLVLGRVSRPKTIAPVKPNMNTGARDTAQVSMGGKGRALSVGGGSGRLIIRRPTDITYSQSFKGNAGIQQGYSRGKGTFFQLPATISRIADARGRYEARGVYPTADESGASKEPRLGGVFFKQRQDKYGAITSKGAGTFQVGGRLKASLHIYQVRHNLYRVEADAPYAKFVEFVTRHNRAQPFLLPALKQAKSKVVPFLEDELRRTGFKR